MRYQFKDFKARRRWATLGAVSCCWTLVLAGCGSSMKDVEGSAKVKKDEERYRYEGTGAAKRKILIRNKEERFKGLPEPSKDPG